MIKSNVNNVNHTHMVVSFLQIASALGEGWAGLSQLPSTFRLGYGSGHPQALISFGSLLWKVLSPFHVSCASPGVCAAWWRRGSCSSCCISPSCGSRSPPPWLPGLRHQGSAGQYKNALNPFQRDHSFQPRNFLCNLLNRHLLLVSKSSGGAL